MPWYIHIHDPQFHEPPWPGQRRFGPYNSPQQALEQAASDVANGSGESVIGIFTGTESRRMDSGMGLEAAGALADHVRSMEGTLEISEKSSPAVTRHAIFERAGEIIEEREKQALLAVSDLRENIRTSLPNDLQEDEKLLDKLLKASGAVR